MTRAPDKNFRDMTADELRAEWSYWDAKVKGATRWGAGLMAAAKFRRAIASELWRRSVPDAATFVENSRIGQQVRPEQSDGERR